MKSLHLPSPGAREAFCHAARGFSIEAFSEGPVAEIARDALLSSGKLRQRQSPLQPMFVLWFLLCRHLFGQDSLHALFGRLVVMLRGRIPQLDIRTVTDGALSHAKKRLGEEPLHHLLQGLADATPPRTLFHGLRVCALDGVRMDVPATRDNDGAFGRCRGWLGTSGWPQVLLLVLLEVSLRIPLDARVAPCHSSEKVVARTLLESLGARDLLLLDAGFYSVPFFLAIEERGSFFLCPAPRHARFRHHGPVRITGNIREYAYRITARERLPLGRTRTVRIDARVIEVHIPGFRTRRLVTNLLDPAVPPAEIVALYRRRWQIEEAFDDIKTVLCHAPAGAAPTELRSKTPQGVCQEAFALLCAYSLIRRTMALAAESAGISPADLSFTAALRLSTQTAHTMLSAPATRLRALYDQLLRDIAAEVLRRPSSPRCCPRVSKRKNLKYARKKQRLGKAA